MKQFSKILAVLIITISFQAHADLGNFIANAFNRFVKVSARDVCGKIQFGESDTCHTARKECLNLTDRAQGNSRFNSDILKICSDLAHHRLPKNCEAVSRCVQISVGKTALSSEHAELCQQVAKSKNGLATVRCLQAEFSDHLLPLCKDAAKWGHYAYANECIAAIDGKTKDDISASAAGVCRVRAGSSAEIHMKGMITCIETAEVKTRGESDVQQRVKEHRSSSAQQ